MWWVNLNFYSKKTATCKFCVERFSKIEVCFYLEKLKMLIRDGSVHYENSKLQFLNLF